MRYLIFFLFLSSCAKNEDFKAYYLDPHLHSIRSADWGSHGTFGLDGSIQSIENYAKIYGIDQVWVTDHIEDNPIPFQNLFISKDAFEWCIIPVGNFCYNQITFDNGYIYKYIVNAGFGVNYPLGVFQGIDVISTGGGNEPSEYREYLNIAISLIQKGEKLTFFGSSNNHASLAGFNGLTAVDSSYGGSLQELVTKHRTTAILDKKFTIFLRELGLDKAILLKPKDEFYYQVVYVYSDHVVYEDLKERDIIPLKGKATFVIIIDNNKLVAATTPIYKDW